MTGFIEAYFKIAERSGEVHVKCPFPHTSEDGHNYIEENASASVNLDKRLFHCSACGAGYTERQLIQKLLHCTTPQAAKLENCFQGAEELSSWAASSELTVDGKELAIRQGIDPLTAISLKIKSHMHNPDALFIPATLFGKVIDVRTYQPGKTPKVLSQKGVPTGIAIPEEAVEVNKVLFMCEGEHDMAVMRSHNLNGCTLTGGCGALPLWKEQFRNKKIAIVYDNDDPGRAGAIRLANELLDVANSVKIVNQFHKIVTEKGGDIADYFTKYNGTREQIIAWYKETPDHVYTPIETAASSKQYMQMTVGEATAVDNVNKIVQSYVQVNATVEESYVAPLYLNCIKVAEGDGQMDEGEQLDWQFDHDHARDILKIVAVNADDNTLRDRYKELCRVLKTEKNVKVTKDCMTNVSISTVSDMAADAPRELLLYCIGHRLESGKKYLITYKAVESVSKAGQLVGICFEAHEATDSVSEFTLNDNTKAILNKFRNTEATIAAKVEAFTEKVKGLLGYNGNDTLIQTIDFAYHTPLEFDFGRFKKVRAYLETLIVGESRTGKSSTATTLMSQYGLGTFVSLAGAAATIPSLIGGSQKLGNGTMQTRAGVIPRNHKGLIVFEEFSKADKQVIMEMTDVRSSGEVRINRVSGTLTLPALVRPIYLSNTKATAAGETKPIDSYANGISICQELVPTAEDIARFDMCLVSPYRGDLTDPFWEPDTPFSTEEYRTRIRWIWSRRADQIKFTEDAIKAVQNWCIFFDKEYSCHIKLLASTESWKKICRLAIAVAGYCVETDETYENIVVSKECVDYAVNFLIKLYDNETFRLREYANNEKKYTEVKQSDLDLLGSLWNKVPTLLIHLDDEANPTKTSAKAALGESEDDYNGVMKTLVQAYMLKMKGNDIIVSPKFRKAMNQCKKEDWVVERLTVMGE